MPLSTNFNVTPYYDDFDESKGYYRILFKPGYGIQARELTQLQTALQNQIDKIGSHNFKNGEKVLGGDITLDTDVHSLQLEMQYLGENINAASFVGKTVVGVTSNARARVVASQAPTSLLQPILMFHYMGGDTFADGEIVQNEVVPPTDPDTFATTISLDGPSAMANAVANGSVVSMDTGIYFIDGHFVLCPANTLILDTANTAPSGRIGLEITETIKTSDDDNSLLDPADGTFNYAAPGATRLDIALSLVKKEINVTDPISQVADPNFIHLLKIIDGVKHENVKYPVYNAIEKTLTKKSHQKSGDFTTTPFDLKLSAHRGISGTTANSGLDGTTLYGNNTRFTTELSIGDKIYLGSNVTAAEVSTIANNSRLTVTSTLSSATEGLTIYNESEIQAGLSSGKAEIDGYEYESVSTEYLDIDKGRGTATDAGYSMGVEVGNYVIIDNMNKFLDVGTHEIVHLHAAKVADINVTTNAEYLATQTGTARIRGLKWDSSSGNTSAPDTNHSNYRAYLYDIDTSNSVAGTVGAAIANTTHVKLFTDDTSFVNTTYVGATITVNTVNGVDSTSDIRLIDEYISNTTGHWATVNTAISQATIANSTYEISFTIGDTKSLTVADYSITLPGASATINSYADISATGKTNDSDSGRCILKDTDSGSLVYPLPQSPVKATVITANTVNYQFKLVESNLTSDAAGKLTVTLANPNYEFLPKSGTLNSTEAREGYIVVVKEADAGGATTAQTFVNAVSAGSSLPNASASIARDLLDGDWLDLGATDDAGTSIRPVVISSDLHTAEIHCNTSSAFTADIIYCASSSTTRKEPGPRTKTLVGGNGSHIGAFAGGNPTNHLASGQFYFTDPNITQTSTDELLVSDGFNLVKVVDSGVESVPVSNAMMTATANDITHMYEFDTGQRDNFYDHSRIKLKPGYSGPAGQIMVVIDYFIWDGAVGYHSVDSYPTAGSWNQKDTTSTKVFDYSSIPEFESSTDGKTYKLRDCIDLRPRRENESNDFKANTAALEAIPTPLPNGVLLADVQYYLPRVDKISLTKDRKFKIIKGTPSLNPVPPPDNPDSMTLYTLNIPAYTFSLNDIITRYVDNKPFSMRDIGKLEKRIERLEYYTSLSLLEKETAARNFTRNSAKNTTFNIKGNAFKNGILIDSYSGHSVGDVLSSDHNISVEYAKKEMRPGFYSDNYKFTYDVSYSNNVIKTGDLVTLPYTDVDFVQQPMSSNTVVANPFNIINFVGNLKTWPSSDVWYDQNTRPTIITNLEGQHDNWKLSETNGFGSQYNDWETNWAGTEITEPAVLGIESKGKTYEEKRTTTEVNDSKTRLGILPTPPDAILKTVGKKVVDTTVVPFINSQHVQFMAKGLRPLTNVYSFFGSTNVGDITRPATILTLGSVDGTFQIGETLTDAANNQCTVLMTTNVISNVATVLISNITGNATSTSASPYGAANGITVGTREHFPDTVGNATYVFASGNTITGGSSAATASITLATKYSVGTANGIMRTDKNGQIAGEILISDGTFRTGDNLLRITDSSLDNVAATVAVAETKWSAKGVLDSHSAEYVSTREIINRREIPDEERLFSDTTVRETEKTNWLNPIAQTFYVDGSNFPKGLFLRSVDLYFVEKDIYLPITVQLRPVVNGFPSTSKVIPFSEVTLNPDSVVTNAIANSASTSSYTRFTFESPVFLPPNEYALVVNTNSTDYKLHIAEEGYIAIGTDATKISKPTYIGTLYRPQNAGWWGTNLDEYLTFRMKRAEFSIGQGGSNNFAKMVVHCNGAYGNTANVDVDEFNVSTSSLDFSDTETVWKYVASNNSYSMDDTKEGTAVYTELSTNQNYKLKDRKRMIATSNGTFRLRAEMTSANSHVSPVIDLDRLNMTTVKNIVDNGELSDSDITVMVRGSGYENVEPQFVTATLAGGGTDNVATLNVHVSVTMNCNSNSTTISSGNSAYTVDGSNPGQFIVGEAVMANTAADVNANNSGIYGVIDSVTYVDGDPLNNVATVTIKTSSNNQGMLANGKLIWANPNAQTNAATGLESSCSNTKMQVLIANGYVSNVVVVDTGTGYTKNPTVTITGMPAVTGSINAAVQCTGEERNSGGPITSKYISRRVTLKEGFDASDMKVVLSAYKPKGTDIHVYYKVHSEADPEEFDLKNYTLMSQETSAGTFSRGEDDFQEFVYKTVNETTEYSSSGALYDSFKTFSVKISMVANTSYDMPRVKDLRAIALD
mgnify:CR=1 FL=1